MSDTRFLMIGIALVFAGFLVLGIFGSDYRIANIESSEFGDCYEYFEDKPPVKIECANKMFDSVLLFGVVLALIAIGIIMLVKGYKGRWDNEVRPEDMLGPGGDKNTSDDEENKKN